MGVFIGDEDSLNVVAPTGGTTAGTPVVIGDMAMFPQSTQLVGEQVTVYPRGVQLLPKVSTAISSTPHIAGEAWVLGQAIYWDAANGKATPKALGPKLGICSKAAASSDTVGEVACGLDRAEVKVATAVFDATAGKAIGTHELLGDSVPSGAMILSYFYYVITTFTSATDAATIALGLTTQDDDCFKTALAISNGANAWDQGVPTVPGSPAAGVLTTASRTICAKVAVEALTAGKLVAGCVYVVPGISA